MMDTLRRDRLREEANDLWLYYCESCSNGLREVDGLCMNNYWCDYCNVGMGWS